MVASSNLAILIYMRHLNHYLNLNESSNNLISSSNWLLNVTSYNNNSLTHINYDTRFANFQLPLVVNNETSLLSKDKTIILSSSLKTSTSNDILTTITKRTSQISKALKTKDINQLSKLMRYYDLLELPRNEKFILNEVIKSAKNTKKFSNLSFYNDLLVSSTNHLGLWNLNNMVQNNYIIRKNRLDYIAHNAPELIKSSEPNSVNSTRLNTWYNIINIKFTQKEYLYTKLKYSRTPAYDIVSGGSAALLAALFGFLIAEKSGFEMLDSGDLYYLFMYGVFISLIIRSFVSSISITEGVFYHLNPKHLLKHLSYILSIFISFFKR